MNEMQRNFIYYSIAMFVIAFMLGAATTKSYCQINSGDELLELQIEKTKLSIKILKGECDGK